MLFLKSQNFLPNLWTWLVHGADVFMSSASTKFGQSLFSLSQLFLKNFNVKWKLQIRMERCERDSEVIHLQRWTLPTKANAWYYLWISSWNSSIVGIYDYFMFYFQWPCNVILNSNGFRYYYSICLCVSYIKFHNFLVFFFIVVVVCDSCKDNKIDG